MQTHLFDLSHTIRDGLITYKGLPAPIVCDFLSREQSSQTYEDGTSFQIGKLELVSNTGTYIDCPFHRYADGKDTSQVNLEKFVDLPGLLIEAPYQNGLEIGISFFEGKELQAKAVLVHTGWSERWNTEAYFEPHPFVTEAAALYLRDQGAALLGIDAYNVDDTRTNRRPVHSILLKEEILIVEHLTGLEQLRDKNFTFSAVPPKIEGMGTFPVRAYGRIC